MRYLVTLVVGFGAGALLALFWANLQRAQDAYPRGVMAAMQHHYDGLRRGLAGPACPPETSAATLRRLRVLSDEVPDAIIEPRDPGPGFVQRHEAFVRALDAAIVAPPADCTALNALVRDLGDRCEACHLEFR